MGADHSRNRTELDDFLAILTQPGDDGKPFIVVGGHAVNYWAKLYLPREPRLRSHLPFTSKDLDVIGSEASARARGANFGLAILAARSGWRTAARHCQFS